jgi:hypothetical protein
VQCKVTILFMLYVVFQLKIVLKFQIARFLSSLCFALVKQKLQNLKNEKKIEKISKDHVLTKERRVMCLCGELIE